MFEFLKDLFHELKTVRVEIQSLRFNIEQARLEHEVRSSENCLTCWRRKSRLTLIKYEPLLENKEDK